MIPLALVAMGTGLEDEEPKQSVIGTIRPPYEFYHEDLGKSALRQRHGLPSSRVFPFRQQVNVLVEVPVSILCGFLGTSAILLNLAHLHHLHPLALAFVDIGTLLRCGENHHGAAHLEEQRRAQGLTFWDIIVDW